MVPQIAQQMYREYEKDITDIDRLLEKEELMYYCTAMLWLRLVHIKQKQGVQALSGEERKIIKDFKDQIFAIPQPMFVYLASVGTVTDKMEKETCLWIPDLPVTEIDGFGGYHAADVTAENHNLFEEVPSLGIAGDLLMTIARLEDAPQQAYRVDFPQNATFSQNLTGCVPAIEIRAVETAQRLDSVGITPNRFVESVPGTRLNSQYLRLLSDSLSGWDTFRIEHVSFANQTAAGFTVQTVTTRPCTDEAATNWLHRVTVGYSSEDDSTAVFGASTMMLFQLYKEPLSRGTVTERNANWCCVTSAAGQVWDIPQAWIDDNRNERRDMPDVLKCHRFRSTALQTEIIPNDTISRMAKESR